MTTALRPCRQQGQNHSARSVHPVAFCLTSSSRICCNSRIVCSSVEISVSSVTSSSALLRSSASLVLASNASVMSRNLLIGKRMQKYTAAAIIRKFNIAPSTTPNETVALLNVIASRPAIFGLPKIMAMNGLITLLTIELTTVVTAPPMTTPTAMSIMLPRAMNFLNPSIMMILPLCETVRCCCERAPSHAFRISIL